MVNITYRYESRSYTINYSITHSPTRFVFNGVEIRVPSKWNTMEECEIDEWYQENLLDIHDEMLDDDTVDCFGVPIAVLIIQIFDALFNGSNRDKLFLEKIEGAVCDFDEMCLELSDSTCILLPTTGMGWIEFDFRNI